MPRKLSPAWLGTTRNDETAPFALSRNGAFLCRPSPSRPPLSPPPPQPRPWSGASGRPFSIAHPNPRAPCCRVPPALPSFAPQPCCWSPAAWCRPPLSELPNKIGSPADQYVLVQQIYRGWALFGILDHRRRAPDPLPQQGRAPCGAAVPGHPCRGACRPPACSGVARRLAAGAYLLLVVATNSGSSCARRSKDKKS
jgi:hypothetical protein